MNGNLGDIKKILDAFRDIKVEQLSKIEELKKSIESISSRYETINNYEAWIRNIMIYLLDENSICQGCGAAVGNINNFKEKHIKSDTCKIPSTIKNIINSWLDDNIASVVLPYSIPILKWTEKEDVKIVRFRGKEKKEKEISDEKLLSGALELLKDSKNYIISSEKNMGIKSGESDKIKKPSKTIRYFDKLKKDKRSISIFKKACEYSNLKDNNKALCPFGCGHKPMANSTFSQHLNRLYNSSCSEFTDEEYGEYKKLLFKTSAHKK